MASDHKKFLAMYVDDSIHREIRVYAAETGQTIQEAIKPISNDFTQLIIKFLAQVREMRYNADQARLREEELQRLADENPIKVSGKEEDPIGNVVESRAF